MAPGRLVRSVKTVAVAPTTPMFTALVGNTGADPPIEPWTLDVNSITVRWAAPAAGGSPITSYQLEVRNDPDGGETNTFMMVDPDDTNGDMIDRSDNTRISNLPASRTWYTHTGPQG